MTPPNTRTRSKAWQLLHLLTRLIGLSGLVAVVVGLLLWFALNLPDVGMIVVASGVGAMVLALLAEGRNLAGAVLSNRGAVGFNSALQIVLATVLVVGVNYYSFAKWHQRYDCTREKTFTLPADVRERLAQMRSDTDIIVYLKHVSFGQRAKSHQDEYEQAAEKKIAEKVIDLKEQFEEIGPRFRVHVLDTQKRDIKARRKGINVLSQELSEEQLEANDHPTAEKPKKDSELLKSIEKAPENSIFFYSRESKQLQRLSFNDIYHLDKMASEEANDGAGNLVLQYQGVRPFARKIFNIEEKTPHLTSAIIHPLLGTQNGEEERFTMHGAKKVLDTYSIVSTDLLLRKVDSDGALSEEGTALTYDESRYEQIEDELTELDESIPDARKQLEENTELLKFWTDKSMKELNEKYIYCYLADGRQMVMLRTEVDAVKKSGIPHKFVDVDDDDRRNRTTTHRQNVDVLKHVLDSQEEEKKNLLKEKAGLKAENLAEKRRFTDLEAKMKAALANVDLLIVPRMTLLNAPRGMVIRNRIHRMDSAQLNAVRAYLKEGKPALFLLGPTNDPGDANPGKDTQSDVLETMLNELGFKLPRQTILYNNEAREFNARKVGDFSKLEVEVPGLKLDDTTQTGLASRAKEAVRPHPIRTSVRLMSRNVSGKDALESRGKDAQEVRIRHPRPVYFVRTSRPPNEVGTLIAGLASPGMAGPLFGATICMTKSQETPDEHAVILVTREESWNEDHPFIAKNKVPRFAPPKDDDPRKGTVEEPRRGPFPIGVAAEADIPSSWYEKDAKPTKARVAVIGSGNAFVGRSLPPLQEKMLLDVVNWLIGRDDLLARDSEIWEYPRLAMTQDSIEYQLWKWGALIGLPLVFFFLGTAVTMVRHMR